MRPEDSLPGALAGLRRRGRGGGDAAPVCRAASSIPCSPPTRPRRAAARSPPAIRRIGELLPSATTHAPTRRAIAEITARGCSRRSTPCGARRRSARQADAARRGAHRDGRLRPDAVPVLPQVYRMLDDAAPGRRRPAPGAGGAGVHAARAPGSAATATATRTSPPTITREAAAHRLGARAARPGTCGDPHRPLADPRRREHAAVRRARRAVEAAARARRGRDRRRSRSRAPGRAAPPGAARRSPRASRATRARDADLAYAAPEELLEELRVVQARSLAAGAAPQAPTASCRR